MAFNPNARTARASSSERGIERIPRRPGPIPVTVTGIAEGLGMPVTPSGIGCGEKLNVR